MKKTKILLTLLCLKAFTSELYPQEQVRHKAPVDRIKSISQQVFKADELLKLMHDSEKDACRDLIGEETLSLQESIKKPEKISVLLRREAGNETLSFTRGSINITCESTGNRLQAFIDNSKTGKTEHNIKNNIADTPYSAEDLSIIFLQLNFIGAFIRMETVSDDECYLLSLRPLFSGSSYTRILLWLKADDFSKKRIDFYKNHESTCYKRLIVEKKEQMDNTQCGKTIQFIDLISGDKSQIRIK